jgi:tetratricopeptide (TPR) repeat protein
MTYKPTLFDRHGPVAAQFLRAWGYGLTVFGLVTGVLIIRVGFVWWVFPAAIISGALVGGMGWLIGEAAGGAWKRVAVDGSSTPYKEQYSYQQALVMQGKLDEALESFEAVIAEKPSAVDPRVKAAELYAREKRNAQRAAELFREVQRIPTASAGEYIYATHRLVDLLTGPLNDPGRALVELRRIVDRYPGLPAAQQAREALKTLKARLHGE